MKYRQSKESKPIPVLLDRALRERIESVSQRMGEAKSTVMRIAMRLGLDTIAAALEIKPAILNQLVAENRETPAALNEPSSAGTKDTTHKGHGDTEQIGRDMTEIVIGKKKPRRSQE